MTISVMTATTPSLREAAKMALDALELAKGELDPEVLDLTCPKVDAAIEALRSALALPEAEPVDDEQALQMILAHAIPGAPQPAPVEANEELARVGRKMIADGAQWYELSDRVFFAMMRCTAKNQPPAPVERKPLSLSELDNLAKVYATSCASPHHITFTVEGLRNLIEATHGIRGES